MFANINMGIDRFFNRLNENIEKFHSNPSEINISNCTSDLKEWSTMVSFLYQRALNLQMEDYLKSKNRNVERVACLFEIIGFNNKYISKINETAIKKLHIQPVKSEFVNNLYKLIQVKSKAFDEMAAKLTQEAKIISFDVWLDSLNQLISVLLTPEPSELTYLLINTYFFACEEFLPKKGIEGWKLRLETLSPEQFRACKAQFEQIHKQLKLLVDRISEIGAEVLEQNHQSGASEIVLNMAHIEEIYQLMQNFKQPAAVGIKYGPRTEFYSLPSTSGNPMESTRPPALPTLTLAPYPFSAAELIKEIVEFNEEGFPFPNQAIYCNPADANEARKCTRIVTEVDEFLGKVLTITNGSDFKHLNRSDRDACEMKLLLVNNALQKTLAKTPNWPEQTPFSDLNTKRQALKEKMVKLNIYLGILEDQKLEAFNDRFVEEIKKNPEKPYAGINRLLAQFFFGWNPKAPLHPDLRKGRGAVIRKIYQTLSLVMLQMERDVKTGKISQSVFSALSAQWEVIKEVNAALQEQLQGNNTIPESNLIKGNAALQKPAQNLKRPRSDFEDPTSDIGLVHAYINALMNNILNGILNTPKLPEEANFWVERFKQLQFTLICLLSHIEQDNLDDNMINALSTLRELLLEQYVSGIIQAKPSNYEKHNGARDEFKTTCTNVCDAIEAIKNKRLKKVIVVEDENGTINVRVLGDVNQSGVEQGLLSLKSELEQILIRCESEEKKRRQLKEIQERADLYPSINFQQRSESEEIQKSTDLYPSLNLQFSKFYDQYSLKGIEEWKSLIDKMDQYRLSSFINNFNIMLNTLTPIYNDLIEDNRYSVNDPGVREFTRHWATIMQVKNYLNNNAGSGG